MPIQKEDCSVLCSYTVFEGCNNINRVLNSAEALERFILTIPVVLLGTVL